MSLSSSSGDDQLKADKVRQSEVDSSAHSLDQTTRHNPNTILYINSISLFHMFMASYILHWSWQPVRLPPVRNSRCHWWTLRTLLGTPAKWYLGCWSFSPLLPKISYFQIAGRPKGVRQESSEGQCLKPHLAHYYCNDSIRLVIFFW